LALEQRSTSAIQPAGGSGGSGGSVAIETVIGVCMVLLGGFFFKYAPTVGQQAIGVALVVGGFLCFGKRRGG
jgi:hypothetical protein